MSDTQIKSLVPEHTAQERFDELMYNPMGSAHLFTLLSQGKGNADDFIRMLDRIIESRRASEGRRASATVMTDNPHVSPYVAEALKRAQLPIRVAIEFDSWFEVGINGRYIHTPHPNHAKDEYIAIRTGLIREQQQVK